MRDPLPTIIHSITEEPSMSDPAVAIPARVSSVLSELDDLLIASSKGETSEIIAAEEIAFGQMITRCQLILSFIDLHKAPPLRVIGRGH